MRNRKIPSDREKVKNHHRTLSLSLRKREKLKKSSSDLKPQESGRSAGASGERGREAISFKINKCYHWTLRAEMRKRWKMRMSKLVVAAVNFPLLCTYSQFMLLSVVGVDGWMVWGWLFKYPRWEYGWVCVFMCHSCDDDDRSHSH